MEAHDDDLSRFEADGAMPLPVAQDQGYVEHDGRSDLVCRHTDLARR